MELLNNVLSWVLEIGGVAVILLGVVLWLRTAVQVRFAARSFMALVFTFVFFLVAVLRKGNFEGTTIRWLAVVYGVILVFYIIARMVEHINEKEAWEEVEEEEGGEKQIEKAPLRSIIMDELKSDISIDTSNIAILIKPRGLFRKRKSIHIFDTVNSEEAKEKVTHIAEKHAADDYYIINELTVK